jgi:hypothetical protein
VTSAKLSHQTNSEGSGVQATATKSVEKVTASGLMEIVTPATSMERVNTAKSMERLTATKPIEKSKAVVYRSHYDMPIAISLTIQNKLSVVTESTIQDEESSNLLSTSTDLWTEYQVIYMPILPCIILSLFVLAM